MSYSVILVRPKYPRNVGMVSRALCNFAGNRLILIDPQCQMDNEAREGAAQGQDPLSQVTIYNSWEDYIKSENEGPRVGFSRRSGRRRPAISLKDLAQWEPLSESRPVSLVFGAEDHGLSASDLQWIHRVCSFEIPGPLKSLNLSHAVVLALSQLTMVLKEQPIVEKAPIEVPDESLRLWLEALNFDLSQDRWNAHIALKQLVMKAAPTHKELGLLNSVIHQTLRRLKNDATSEKNC